MDARKVGVRQLRQNLSVYLDRVKRGESLTVTEHGAAVALLRPLPAESQTLARLVAEGAVTPPRAPLRVPHSRLAGRLPRPLARLLDEAREERLD